MIRGTVLPQFQALFGRGTGVGQGRLSSQLYRGVVVVPYNARQPRHVNAPTWVWLSIYFIYKISELTRGFDTDINTKNDGVLQLFILLLPM